MVAASLLTLTFASTLLATVSAHGYLYAPKKVSASTPGSVRDAKKISYQIDDLRNPSGGYSFCRNAGKGTVTPITLADGQQYTVTLALSIGAMHIGHCWMYIVDADNHSKSWQIAAQYNCAAGSTTKSPGANQQCSGMVPYGLVTNDMCIKYWTFTVSNAKSITCKNCIMRWVWHAEHISTTNPEVYENCADITLTVNGGYQGGSQNTVLQQVPKTTTTKQSGSQPTSSPSTGNKGDWDFCSVSSECSNKCCSKVYSNDNRLKCTPGGYNCVTGSSPSSPSPSPYRTVGAGQRCGSNGGGAHCNTGLCCSSKGWCGTTEHYCNPGYCNGSYGSCKSVTSNSKLQVSLPQSENASSSPNCAAGNTAWMCGLDRGMCYLGDWVSAPCPDGYKCEGAGNCVRA